MEHHPITVKAGLFPSRVRLLCHDHPSFLDTWDVLPVIQFSFVCWLVFSPNSVPPESQASR